jgi:hypothetical protein
VETRARANIGLGALHQLLALSINFSGADRVTTGPTPRLRPVPSATPAAQSPASDALPASSRSAPVPKYRGVRYQATELVVHVEDDHL